MYIAPKSFLKYLLTFFLLVAFLSPAAFAGELNINPFPGDKAGKPPVSLLKQKAIYGRWESPVGASLEETLRVWCEAAGVKLVWKAELNFPVYETIVMEGTFQEAIGDLLQQYASDTPRPVGDLHVDPKTDDRVLIVYEIH